MSNHDLIIKATEKKINSLQKLSNLDDFETKVKSFKEILISPFMLKILGQTLPKLTENNINRSELYRLFSIIHFEEEQKRLLKTGNVPLRTNLIESFYQYSKDLAVNMFIRGVSSINAKPHNYQMSGILENETKKPNVWDRFFESHDPLTKLARQGAQIIEDDGVVRFVHKSIMEYFAAQTFYDEIVEFESFEPEYEFCFNKGKTFGGIHIQNKRKI